MASNGLINRAINGKCRICHRVRDTGKHVTPVGEVNHGFAVGHVWECIDKVECIAKARQKVKAGKGGRDLWKVERALNVIDFPNQNKN